MNVSKFGDFVHCIYCIEPEVTKTTYTAKSPSYLDPHLYIVSEGWLKTNLYDNRDYFKFPIVNFPFRCRNIPPAPAYGVYVFPSIRYNRVYGALDRSLLLARMLWNKGSLVVRLRLSEFYSYQHDSVNHHIISLKLTILSWLCVK